LDRLHESGELGLDRDQFRIKRNREWDGELFPPGEQHRAEPVRDADHWRKDVHSDAEWNVVAKF
jgi:hypothetical protein